MKIIELSVLTLCLLFQRSRGLKCYTCASQELYQDWQITGFPKQPAKALFSATRCENPDTWKTNNPPNGFMAPCQSMCVTLTVEKTQFAGPYFVRGCADTLLGFQGPDRADGYCAYSTVQKLDAHGEEVSTPVQLQYCKANDYCNNKATWVTSGSCNSQVANGGKMVTCKLCSSYGSDCTSGSCQGYWCTKSAGKIGNKLVVNKGCSPFNLYSNSNNCQAIKTTNFLDLMVEVRRRKRGVLVPYEGKYCYCNSDNCNGTGVARLSALAAFFFAFFIVKTAM